MAVHTFKGSCPLHVGDDEVFCLGGRVRGACGIWYWGVVPGLCHA